MFDRRSLVAPIHCSWRTLAEVKMQQVNKLVAETDRTRIHLRAMGVETDYRNQPGVPRINR